VNALPYPTPTRLRLAESIDRGEIRHYPFIQPQTTCQTTGNIVTARVAEFVAAGLAEIPEPTDHDYSLVLLTVVGRAWRERAINREASPGSTSPKDGSDE
jgi:hypothetical protein